MKRCVLGVLLLWPLPVFAGAQSLAPVRYTLSLVAAQTHYMDVQASIPTDGQRQLDLMMPVWTPGSYLVREYSRNVESLTASDESGAPLPIEKTRKNRWRVTAGSATAVQLRYRVYAHEMSVRTNWIDDEFALLNGAATYITVLEHRDRPYEIRLRLPGDWARSVSPLASSEPNTYVAPDYDTLIDSPILAGNPAIYEFRVAGKPHYLVDFAERGEWDGSKAAQDLSKVVAETVKFWGGAPYQQYYFFNILGSPENGLEHKSCTVLNAPRESTKTRAGYLSWLALAGHEFFHAWNVKRLRPIELGPFDYENEVYTKSLWFAEGVTDYYADLIVHRAGISTVDEYLSSLSNQIASVQTTPGRMVQPLESASYDSWIKYYRPDENSPNASISYYTKGAVVGFLLDSELRRDTRGTKSLDDMMRLMYERYSGAKGFSPEDLRASAIEVAGQTSAVALRRWLSMALETPGDLDYKGALGWFGLQFKRLPDKPRVVLGVRTRLDGQRTIVTEVRRGTPASAAGIDLGDEIVAVNDVPVNGQLTDKLASFAPGARVTFTIGRRGVTNKVDTTLTVDPTQLWQLGIQSSTSGDQRAHLDAWLQ